MNFTYEAYESLVELLRKKGYTLATYDDYDKKGQCAIMRHDIDYSLEYAHRFAEVEQKIGVNSTYFLLVTSDFYNLFSLKSLKKIEGILACGHEVGLHFDEMRYSEAAGKIDEIREKILVEVDILSKVIGKSVTKVSMHRPSKGILESNLEMGGVINTYSKEFFHVFKYLSDSRHFWREPIEDIIENQLYKKLQILIHPFWYNEKEKTLNDSVRSFINHGSIERYYAMDENITDLSSIVDRREVTV